MEESNVSNMEQQNVPTNKKPKKKKSRAGLVFLLIFLIVFIILPGTLLLLAYDTSMLDITYDETFNQEKFSKSLIYNSLDNVAETGYAEFSASESDVNNLIYSGYKNNSQVTKYVKQFAVDIKDDEYVFTVSAKYAFYQTRVKLTTKFEKTMVEDHGESKEAYTFQIKGASIGKLPVKDLVTFIAKKAVNDSIKQSLYNTPLKLNLDLDNSRLYILTSDFASIVDQALSHGSSEYSDFLAAIVNDFLNSKLLEFGTFGNEALAARIMLSEITGNDYGEGQYVYYKMPYETTTTKLTIGGEQKQLSLDTIKEALIVLLNNGLIEESQMSNVSEYLFNGYHDSNAPTCSLTSIGINNKESYRGFDLPLGYSVSDIISNGITSFAGFDTSLNSFNIANITEKNINDYLHSQYIFGNKFFLTNEVEAGQYKTSYVALDNTYINFTEDGAVLSVGLNINGLETILTLLMNYDAASSSGTKLVYDTNELYFGETKEDNSRVAASNPTKALIFKTLKNAISDNAFVFSEDGKLTIDFTNVINQAINNIGAGNAAYKDFLQHHSTCSVAVDGENIADNTVIRINANRN